VKPWVLYSLARLGIFAVVLAALLLLGITPWIAALVAAVVGLCVAYIFFGTLRNAVALDLAERRSQSKVAKDSDAEAEDLENDARF
jgi:uncharacterized membrane protein YphA (DoxX/SURF4 family)